MLSIGKMSRGQEAYYSTLAREDYYLEGGEPPGRWRGQGAEKLGLEGAVESQILSDLFAGNLDGKSLVKSAWQGRCPGWDLTFSPPKSVSTLWSQAEADKAKAIQDLHDEAVGKALQVVEERCGFVRRGKAGFLVEEADLVFATFEHGTSRAQQPQLHTHSLLLNIGVTENGHIGALKTDQVFAWKKAVGTLYRAEFSKLLEERLGLKTEKDGMFFQISGVDGKLCDHFSDRRKEIEAKLQELDLQGAKNAAKIALTSRKNKENETRSILLEKWKETGRSFGWSSREVDLLIGKAQPRTLDERSTLAGFSVVEGIGQLMESQSYFTEREAILHAAEFSQGRGAGIEEVIGAVGEYLKRTNPKIVALGVIEGEAHYTTIEQYQLEKEFEKRIETMTQEPGLKVSDKVVQKAIEASVKEGKPLTAEQESAMRHILQEPGRISTIIGDAGTGKTTMLKPAKQALEKSGYQVIGAALAGKAAQGMQQGTGIESRTITSLNWMLDQIEKGWNEKEAKKEFTDWVESERKRRGLLKGSRLVFDPKWSRKVADRSWQHYKKFVREHALGPKSVVVIDEAGMADTRQMAKLLGHIDRAGAKAVFIGDEKQLQAVTQGGGFKFLSEVIQGKRLTEIFRQKNPGDKNAVADMARGKVKNALKYYASEGRLEVLDERPLAKESLIDSWSVEGISRPNDHLILTGMNADVDDLNRRAQELRLQQGYLSEKSIKVGDNQLREGDRIVFTRNEKSLGVTNGDFGTVRRFNTVLGTVTVELDGPGSPEQRSRTFKPSKYRDIKLSYAVTTHKAQGMTVANTYVLTDDKMMDRELSYVQISRSEHKTRIFTTRDEAGDELRDLTRQMERSRQKKMAIALEQEAARNSQSRGR